MGPIALPTEGLVYLDSALIIYGVESHPVYAPLLAPLWINARSGLVKVVTSEFALSEALVGAFRKADARSVEEYRGFRRDPDVRMVDIDAAVVERAAELRAARSSLRAVDAIHIATAELAGCDAFVTNDKALRSISSIPVVMLDDLL